MDVVQLVGAVTGVYASGWRHEQQSIKAAVTAALHHSRDEAPRRASVAPQNTFLRDE